MILWRYLPLSVDIDVFFVKHQTRHTSYNIKIHENESFNVNYQSLYIPLFCVIDFVLTFHYDLCMYQILKREKPLKGVQGCGKSSYFVDVWYTDTEVIPWNHCNSVKDIRYEYLEQNNRGCKKVKKNHISRLSFL